MLDFINNPGTGTPATPKVFIANGEPGILANELEPIASGGIALNSRCDVDVRALQTIVIVAKHFGSATINDLNRGCADPADGITCASSQSPAHCWDYNGNVATGAIDFGAIGQIGSPSQSSADSLFSFLAGVVPQVADGTYVEALCDDAEKPFMHKFNVPGAGCDHHHLDFRNTSSPLNLPAAAPVDAGVVQMIRDGGGQIWAKAPKDYSNGNWGQQTPGAISKMATGGGVHVILDGGGNVWAKRTLGSGGWAQETQGGGIKNITVSSNGTQMILDNGGTVWAKAPNAALDMTWVRETPVNNGVTQIATGGATQVMVDSTGIIWGKNNSVALGGWSPISSSTSVKQISVGSNGWVMMLDAAGTVWLKTSNTFDNATWTRETAVGANTQYISTNGGVQALIDAGGQAWVRTSVGIDGWTPQTAGGQNKKVAVGSNGSQMILTTDGIVYVKQPNAVFSQNWSIEAPAGILDIAIG
ncbi:hypothetical protein [Herbiconiux liangxiaofengii]|uniref:hypothetical protein n=1 Tax=Herbiconiux liangxiaofengii TaxID=3342795 RepID=UPI0035BBBABC